MTKKKAANGHAIPSDRVVKAVEKLRIALVDGVKFSETFELFMKLAEDLIEDLLDVSQPTENEMLRQIILHSLQSTAENRWDNANIMFLNVPSLNFYHGGIITPKYQGSYFYFQDMTMGMLAIGLDEQGNVRYARFTGELVPQGAFAPNKFSHTVH